MVATRGWSAAETAEVFRLAKFLAERGGGGAKLFQVFIGLHNAANTRGELRQALALAEQMVEIARGIGTPAALVSDRRRTQNH